MKSIDYDKLTPMMKQYMDIKKENTDKILFYRLGDFYEMFFDDALIASKELEIALTGRECGLDERAPMCGVPYHSATNYINRLVNKGYKIAIVEQVEDPSKAKSIVKRSIVKIVSPGMLLDLDGKEKDNNYIVSLYISNNSAAISYADITTGEFKTTEIVNSSDIYRDIIDFISKLNPKEIVMVEKIDSNMLNNYIENNNIYISYIDNSYNDIKSSLTYISKKVKIFDKNFYKTKFFSIISSHILLDYIYLFLEDNLEHIDKLEYIENKKYMKIDANTRVNLELHKNINDNTKKNTLLEVLDKSSTPMGSRKINSWIEFPLLDINDINYRLDIVDYLYNNTDVSQEISDILNQIYDLERILSKISYNNCNAKDLLVLKNSIANLPKLKDLLVKSDYEKFNKIGKDFDSLDDLFNLINNSIREDAVDTITEGNIIKEGFNKDLDEIKETSNLGRKKLLEYEKEERENTKIPKLKISFNNNVGYYIEVTKANIKNVPDHYIRRQTLKNSERYITNRLNEISDMILDGKNEIIDLEYKIFSEIRETVSKNSTRIKDTTDIISDLDSYNSFAKIAILNNYTRPIFNKENYIYIKDGRHPVIEKSISSNQFIPNDTLIGKDNKLIQIITGPNMSGKSTYMRQVALIILMSQIGSFVPASSCDISISDALFTRIGASDNLAKGESTFMVEMMEMSNIINNATDKSFVILDEVGRGTSTYDGYSIAKSIIEYMSNNTKSKTLFATHYHELTDLEDSLDNVENLKVKVVEENNEVVFLRKIIRGKTDKSYGIEVAKLSGLPEEIVFRANTILQSIDKSNITENKQLSFTLEDDNNNDLRKDILLKELTEVNIENITPIKAFELLNSFVSKSKDIYND